MNLKIKARQNGVNFHGCFTLAMIKDMPEEEKIFHFFHLINWRVNVKGIRKYLMHMPVEVYLFIYIIKPEVLMDRRWCRSPRDTLFLI